MSENNTANNTGTGNNNTSTNNTGKVLKHGWGSKEVPRSIPPQPK